jgi:5-methylcytosine-specific restriction enzyme subunit McrC
VKAKKELTLFEFDFVAKDVKAEYHSIVHKISAVSYDYLKQLCLGDERDSRLLKLRSVDGMEVLQLQNYAGVIFTPDKTQIEILPKIGRGNENGVEQSRQSLLTMLRALKGFKHIQTASANIAAQRTPLIEVFITQFIQSVIPLVKHGLRSDYVCTEENLAFLKGKLNVGRQLRHNFINKHKFYCEYDKFLQDRPANRLIHSTLQKVKPLIRSVANQKLMQELEFAFYDIPESKDHNLDFSKVKLDRGMNYYQKPLEWCRMILEGYSPLTMKGNTHAASLLFPMEKVFEDFVAKVLKSQLAAQRDSELRLDTQVRGQFLTSYQKKGMFSLRPDLIIRHGNRNIVVLDTKWKLLDASMSNANISQSDIYQMFAYAKKYLSSNSDLRQGRDVVLIYPMQDNFNKPFSESYDLGDNHRLWVVPFEIDQDNSRIHWPNDFDTIVDMGL